MRGPRHTPGPWTYEYSPYTSQDGMEIPAFEVHGAEKVCDTNEDRPREEQEANARLIAAAPELLEALKDVMEEYEKFIKGLEDEDPESCLEAVKARVAIAKATTA